MKKFTLSAVLALSAITGATSSLALADDAPKFDVRSAIAGKPPATKKPAAQIDPALVKAAAEDPDVAARMKTDYPLESDDWKQYPLGVLEMEMQEVIDDLSSGKPRPPSLVTQPRIISRFDALIEEMEKKCNGSGSGSGPGSNSGNKPAESSSLKSGAMKDGEIRAVKKDGDRWANLSPKEREKILESQNEGFPAGYEDVLADYFRKLSKSEKAATGTPKDAPATKPVPATPPATK